MAKENLFIYLERLIILVPAFEKQNDVISKASIGWHIEHIFKVLINVTETIKTSNPLDFKSNFNFLRILIFITKKIPRGKAKAPKSVLPLTDITTESLLQNAAIAKQRITELHTIDSNKYFNHPFLGNVKLNSCIKFLTIHTKHHLKIIEDINNGHT